MVNSVEKRKFHCRLLNVTFAASFSNFRLFLHVVSSKYTFIKSSQWLDLNLDPQYESDRTVNCTSTTAKSEQAILIFGKSKKISSKKCSKHWPMSFKFNEFKQGHNHQNFPLGVRNDKIEQHRHRGRRWRLADVVQIVFRVDRVGRLVRWRSVHLLVDIELNYLPQLVPKQHSRADVTNKF